MEWQLAILIIFGSLVILMATGLPIAFCFLLFDLVAMFLWWGGVAGLEQLIMSIRRSVSSFILLPLPMFILMGELMFHTAVGPRMIDALDKWIGRLPGRLSLLAVAGGTVFATLTGASMGSTAMLGSTLVPEMEKRGYKKPMSLGPILGSGGLAIMIPPSGLAIFAAAIGQFSVGRTLLGIIVPGLIMALFYGVYTIGRCWLQSHLAPPYKVPPIPLAEKLLATAKYILPIGFIIFLVIGVFLLGIATPTEAAALGTIGSFILAAAYGTLKWDRVKEAIRSSLNITVMIFLILTGAAAFGQILGYSGASEGLAQFIVGLPLTPISVVIAMQAVLLFLGCFMSVTAIMMITLPIFVPIIVALGLDPVWFGVIVLLNMEMATTTPPFGLSLFVMKGVAPPDTTMGDIYKAALPYLGCDLIVMALLIFFPPLVLWLPSLMR